MKFLDSLKENNEIKEIVLGFRRVFIIVALFSMVINMLMLVPSIYMLQVYDRVLASQNTSTLLMLTLIMLGLYLVMSSLEFVRSKVLIRVGNQLDHALSERILSAAFARNLQQYGGNPQQALGDLIAVRQYLTGAGLIAIFDVPWIPVYFFIIFMFGWPLGVFALFAITALAFLTWLNEFITRSTLLEANKLSIQNGAMVSNQFRNAEVIEAMGMLQSLKDRWFKSNEKLLILQTRASDLSANVMACSKFLRVAMQSLILGLGALLVINGSITAGMMIAGSILLGRALAPLEALIGTWKSLLSSRAAYERLCKLLADYPLPPERMSLPAPRGFVNAESLVIAPSSNTPPILKGITFEIAPGVVVGLIGPSASGKSTLARAMVGVIKPRSGSIRLDGADIAPWNKTELGPYIGYLPQDVELFSGSIAENIARFGEIDSSAIVAAATLAGVHDMILHFPQGYDTTIGEGAMQLSGGQKQRIGLARALYGSPKLVVLDEPNSNLDDVGELALVNAIQTFKQSGATIVIITHRLNILSVVDRLLVLRDGSIFLYGPKDDVIKKLSTPASGAKTE